MQKRFKYLDSLDLMGTNLKWFGVIAGFLNIIFFIFLKFVGMNESTLFRLLAILLFSSLWFYRSRLYQELVYFVSLPVLFCVNFILNQNPYWFASMVFCGLIYGILSNFIFSPILYIGFIVLYLGISTVEITTVIAASSVSMILGYIFRRYFSILQNKISLQNREIMSMEQHKDRLQNAGMFVGSVTHQLGNSIGSVVNWHRTAMIHAKKNSETNEKLIEVLEKMKISLDYSINVIESMDYATKNNLKRSDENIKDLISGSVAIVKGEVLENIKIVIDVDEGINFPVHGGSILQIIMITLKNSKYALRDRKDGEYYIGAKISNDDLIITIKDNGPGIPKENIDDLFKPFRTTKDQKEGTGIGLYSLMLEAKQNNGDAKYSFDNGPVFTIRFRR